MSRKKEKQSPLIHGKKHEKRLQPKQAKKAQDKVSKQCEKVSSDFYQKAIRQADTLDNKTRDIIYNHRQKTSISCSLQEESQFCYESAIKKADYAEKANHDKLLFNNKAANKQKFIDQLQKISDQALQDGLLNHALKAQEMVGKAEGYFNSSNKQNRSTLTLQECSEEDIDQLIEELRLANNSIDKNVS